MSDRGAVLVEFAIVAPLLMLLVLGFVSVFSWTSTKADLERTAQAIAEAEYLEDEAAAVAASEGYTLTCYAVDAPCGDSAWSGTRLEVVVAGTAPTFIPGMADLKLSAHAVQPTDTIEVSP